VTRANYVPPRSSGISILDRAEKWGVLGMSADERRKNETGRAEEKMTI
jgi:hypothetical protein